MSAKKLVINATRSVTGAILASLFWLGTGWVLSSLSLGVVLCALSLIVGPWLIPVGTWLHLRYSRKLTRLDVGSDTQLTEMILKQIATQPGLDLVLWVREGRDLSFVWWESFSQSKTNLMVSTAWLQESRAHREHDLDCLWTAISENSPRERRLRTVQILFWVGALAPAEILLLGLQVLLSLLKWNDLPSPGFWSQRLTWELKKYWMGTSREHHVELPTVENSPCPPAPWSSVTWGVWAVLPLRAAHTTWPLLMHRDAFLNQKPS